MSKLIKLVIIAMLSANLALPEIAARAETPVSPSIIPLPQQMEVLSGRFVLEPGTAIYCSDSLLQEASYLAGLLGRATGYELAAKPLPEAQAGVKGSTIRLVLAGPGEFPDEGYALQVTPGEVLIRASATAGAFYGIQSLIQLFPPEILSDTKVSGVDWGAPAVRIKDQPRFGWRAYLQDEARWFHGLEALKLLLDQMALLKMNVFNLYLTDDQGWRIEIKRYPRLTEIGSKRTDSQTGGWNSEERFGKLHSGFYTQEEIREIVRYAAERHITVVPVISMPGHASAAIAAYPEMGTDGKPVEVAVTFGKKYDTFNVADEKVYTFLENILDEVMELFPSRVIHLGGDEVIFDQWMASPMVKALMEREGLSGPAQVQMYFTNRMSQFLESRGRRMMGWNEILGDDLHGLIKQAGGKEVVEQSDGRALAKGAVVHFWKGSLELAERAAREGHDIVNSLHSATYLDYTYEEIPLAKAYAFDPIPSGLEQKYQAHVLGSGCQMWGEWVPTLQRLEYQTFPRIAAYAEVDWTAPERKDFSGFSGRLNLQKKRWDIQGIGYAPDH